MAIFIPAPPHNRYPISLPQTPSWPEKSDIQKSLRRPDILFPVPLRTWPFRISQYNFCIFHSFFRRVFRRSQHFQQRIVCISSHSLNRRLQGVNHRLIAHPRASPRFYRSQTFFPICARSFGKSFSFGCLSKVPERNRLPKRIPEAPPWT